MAITCDLAVVGGGIVGLAHAWEAARRGWRVAVLERDQRARGASIRNFGMILPLGMAPGKHHRYALDGRAAWLQLARAAGFWIKECGALIPVYRQDELAVIEEFADIAAARGYAVEMRTAKRTKATCPAVRAEGLLGGLFSSAELGVDPRCAVEKISRYLRQEFGVVFCFGESVLRVDLPTIETAAGGMVRAEKCVVCAGADVQTLFPTVFQNAKVRRCKLQMMRTNPQTVLLKPHLASALSLPHYESFSDCPSLSVLQNRIAAETPQLVEFGIHLLIAQNELGEVLIGDSHGYGDARPGLSPRIEKLIMDYARQLIALPDWTIAARWSGVYVKPVGANFFAAPQKNVRVITGIGGAGMTLSFALAKEVCDSLD